MKIIEINDINIYYIDDDQAPRILVKYSTEMNRNKIASNALNLDLLLAYKKTPLALMVDGLTQSISDKYDSRIIKFVNEFVSYILLTALDPSFIISSKRALFMKNDLFRVVEQLFSYDQFGKKCIDIQELLLSKVNISPRDVKDLFDTLETEKFLKRIGNRYCIDSYVIKNLKIG